MESNTDSELKVGLVNLASDENSLRNETDLMKLNSSIEDYLLQEKDYAELLTDFKDVKSEQLQRLMFNLAEIVSKREKELLIGSKILTYKKKDSYSPSQTAYHFHHLAEMYPHAIVQAELATGKIHYVNSKCMDLLAFQDFDLEKKNFYEVFVFEENTSDFIKNLTEDGAILNFEAELAREDSSFFLASITASVLQTNSGKEFIVSLMNVEQEKMLTEERERLLEELALSRAQIEEEAGRYVQVNLQLAESEEKLQELNATKDKFFSIIGHDLKNPLFVIQSMSEILETEFNEITEEEKMTFIKAVRESSNSAFALLENLLHWARSQSGRIDYDPQPLSIEEIVKDLFSLVEAQALKKHILLLSHINAQHKVLADKFMLSTMLRNLVSNAIKFTDTGGRVMIVTKEVNDMIEVAVIDSGMGMSKDDVSKLFRIDVKNHEIGKSKEKGTGLGLILCKEFAERHGGRIWVESELGKGSKFKFIVPKSI